ncbi:MAG: histidine kinase, partial [Brevundimonas sp.]|nr:histidine kinase [Brevundimonas sp.]
MSVSRVLNPPARGVAPNLAPDAARPLAARRSLRGGSVDANGFFLQPLIPMATACAVALLTLLAIRFGTVQGVVVLWLANAVAATVWVRSGKGLAFDLCFGGVIMVGVVTGELLTGYPPVTGLILAAVNVLEIAVAVALMRRFSPGQSLSTVRSALTVIGVAGLVAPLVGASVGAFALAAMKGVPLLQGFQVWWIGHALGTVLVTPIILSINRRSLRHFANPLKVLEWIGLLTAVAAVAYALYFVRVGPVAFLLNMVLVIIAARLRFAGIGLAMLITALIVFAAIIYRPAPPNMVGIEITTRIAAAQATMLSVYLPFLLVATLLTDRDGMSARARAGQRRAELASESKSRLLANVAHEIKSPVAGVIGIGELWSGGQLGPVNATQKEMADMLVKTARQVETLAHDLLDVARAESGAVKVELRPTDVIGVLEDVCRATGLR